MTKCAIDRYSIIITGYFSHFCACFSHHLPHSPGPIYKVPEEVADDLAGVGLFDIYIEEACNEAADWFLKHLSATE